MASQQLKVSLNKIAEFTYATSARKERIVRDQKNKTAFRAAGYKEAEDFIPQFFSSNQNILLLSQQIKSLSALHTLTPKDSLNNSVNGLLALQEMAPLELGEVTFHSVPRNQHDGIIIENVFINVRPDVLITKKMRGGIGMGAVKLHFPKSSKLGEKGGQCVAAVLFDYLSQLDVPLGTPKHNLCYLADVYPNMLCQSPASHKIMTKELEAACRQYELIWHSI